MRVRAWIVSLSLRLTRSRVKKDAPCGGGEVVGGSEEL